MKSEHPKRGRRPLKARDRKDKIVQTRIPEELETLLKEAALEQDTSVSNLIRNLLENTFDLVDNLVTDSANLVGTVASDAKRIATGTKVTTQSPSATANTPQIDSWISIVPNRDLTCWQCHTTLTQGKPAWQASGHCLPQPLWSCKHCLHKKM